MEILSPVFDLESDRKKELHNQPGTVSMTFDNMETFGPNIGQTPDDISWHVLFPVALNIEFRSWIFVDKNDSE